MIFKEPTLHRHITGLPSVHVILWPSGAVAPPLGEPAVHVPGRSRRPAVNIAVN